MAGWPAHVVRRHDGSKGHSIAGATGYGCTPGTACASTAVAVQVGSVRQTAPLEKLENQITSFLPEEAAQAGGREEAVSRILGTISATSSDLGLKGKVEAFGSHISGFQNAGSDLDVCFLTPSDESKQSAVAMLRSFANAAPPCFENVTVIFASRTPLLKFVDSASGIEVDFCINNRLGLRNSAMLHAYRRCDSRVALLGRLVKDWAKANELMGTADGCLNSYAYMLLVIHYLQQCSPPVVPNLQILATEPVPTLDCTRGCNDIWDTKFFEDVDRLPPSKNCESTSELLLGFFNFFGRVFNWSLYAVCIRLNGEKVAIDKFSLALPLPSEQWYVEDPFDLKHNLACQCTPVARQRIRDKMCKSHDDLRNGGDWVVACPPLPVVCFLKFYVTQAVTPEAILEEFSDDEVVRLYYPTKNIGERGVSAYLEFRSPAARRKAHSKNERYIADCQLLLLQTSCASLQESREQGEYETFAVDIPRTT
mmetsp:Transcript_63166/g.137333  ORF Transcript_63166/g.137333 Transcript_63166/m.137333 type:complete len:481 (-) Transcript_63166:118-1560(-)